MFWTVGGNRNAQGERANSKTYNRTCFDQFRITYQLNPRGKLHTGVTQLGFEPEPPDCGANHSTGMQPLCIKLLTTILHTNCVEMLPASGCDPVCLQSVLTGISITVTSVKSVS